MKLTAQLLTALTLPPGKTDALFFDGEVPGLALRLRAGGARGWVFQYRLGSKQRRLSLGSASAISVHEARKLASKLHAQVKLGQDPVGAKSEARARADETFGAVFPLFLSRQKERLRPRAYVEVERHLKTHAKRLHAVPLASVTRRDVAAVLTATASRLSGASANRVRTSLSSYFSWSVREGLLETNPAAWTERREEVARGRLLADAELREIWPALRDDAYSDVDQASDPARQSPRGNWRLKVERNRSRTRTDFAATRAGKNKRPHEIMLSKPAIVILRARPRLTWPDGSPCDLVFGRGARGFSGWVGHKITLDSRIAKARQTAKLPPMPGWTLHDFRRLISTAMHDRLGVLPHIVESVLGHVGHRAGTAGRYNLALYRADKAAALARWAEHVLALVEGRDRNVVPLQRA